MRKLTFPRLFPKIITFAILKPSYLLQQSLATVLSAGHVLKTIGVPASKNAAGQSRFLKISVTFTEISELLEHRLIKDVLVPGTQILTIPFQQGGISGTPTKLLLSTPNKLGSGTGETILLPRNAKIVTASPANIRTAAHVVKAEPSKAITNVDSPVTAYAANKVAAALSANSAQKSFISPILDHSRKRQQAEADYSAE